MSSDSRRFTPVRAHKAAFQQREVKSSLRRAIAQAGPWGWDPVRVGVPRHEPVDASQKQKHFTTGTRS